MITKHLTCIITSIVLFGSLNAQTTTTVIDLNQAAARINNDGLFFQNIAAGQPGYEIPKGSGANIILSSSFWYAGMLEDTVLGMATNVFGGSNSDFSSGPIATNYSDQNYINRYADAMWSFTQAEIDLYEHYWNSCVGPNASQIACDALTANEIPSNDLISRIVNWPAHGDYNNGEIFYMAPFVDKDMDGLYEPQSGDLPKIKGCSAVYMILNDENGVHSSSGGAKMGIEIHYLFYQFESFNAINNTTFIDMKLYNRSNDTIEDFIITNFLDGDLGGPNDDYFGSNPSKNLMYYYNGDNQDNTDGGSIGYGENPPSFGLMCLSDDLSSVKQYSSFLHGDSFNKENIYRQMHGIWGDSTDILDNLNQPTKFQYSGDPNLSGSFNEIEMQNTPGDRRGMMSIELGDLIPSFDESIGMIIPVQLSFAVIYSRTGDNLENVNSLFETADFIQDFYDQQQLGCHEAILGLNEITEFDKMEVFPNPVTDKVILSLFSSEKGEGHIFSSTGKELKSFKVDSKTTEIDCSELAAGMYMIYINQNGRIFSSQIVKVD